MIMISHESPPQLSGPPGPTPLAVAPGGRRPGHCGRARATPSLAVTPGPGPLRRPVTGPFWQAGAVPAPAEHCSSP
jgi:hypothetical protein